jgi:hypothetical protein
LKIVDGHRVLVTMPDVIEHVRNRVRPEIQAVSVSVDAM